MNLTEKVEGYKIKKRKVSNIYKEGWMKKVRMFIAAIVLLGLVVNPVLVSAQSAGPSNTVKLPSGKTYTATQSQVESLKKQPGVQFSQELPAQLPKGKFAASISPELGGGYLIGTSQALADALNTVGITTGLTAAALSGVGIGIGVAVVSVIGVIAGALAADDDGGGAAASHHAAPSHH
jgi:hypothetical protein